MVTRHLIKSLDDRRVAPYRNLRERTLRGQAIFIAEGLLLVERLLRSRYPTESILTDEESADAVEEMARVILTEKSIGSVGGNDSEESRSPSLPIFVLPRDVMIETVGFKFHRGAMALGRRDSLPSVGDLLDQIPIDRSASLMICPETTSPDNVGLMLRTAAALGIDGTVFGPRSCDPFSRRALRTSMGGVLTTSMARSENLIEDLSIIRDRGQFELVGTVLDASAESLDSFTWPRRSAVLFGNEYFGLGTDIIDCCDRLVTLPMESETDSLNVSVASGVFLYQMKRMQKRNEAEGGER